MTHRTSYLVTAAFAVLLTCGLHAQTTITQNETFDGASLTGDFVAPAGTIFNVSNSTFDGGTTTLQGSVTAYLGGSNGLTIGPAGIWSLQGSGNYIYADNNGQVTLTNQGTISAETNGYSIFYGPGFHGYGLTIDNQNQISATGQNSDLTLGSSSYDVVINEAGANITASGGASLNIGGAFTNNGQVTSTGNGSWLQVENSGGTWTNNGTMTASSGGTLQLEGTYSGSALGNIVNSGGTVDLSGTLNLGSAALAGPGGGGVYTLYRGTINGGTADASVLSLSSGWLNGVTLTGGYNLTNSELFLSNTQFANGVTLSGSNQLYLNGNLAIGAGQTWNLAGGGNYIYAENNGQVTLTNQGTISAGANSSSVFYGPGYYGYGLTIDNQNQISATGQNSNLTLGEGSYDVVTNEAGATITASGGGQISIGGAFTNNGQVTSTGNSSWLQVGSNNGTWTNNGTMTASSGGTLQLEGTYLGSGLGNIVNSGGTVDLSGTFNLGSGALAAPGGGGVYTLYQGTINGGTADASVLSLSSGTLNGVTLTGGYNLTNSTLTLNNTQFANGVTLSGSNQLYLNGNLAIGAGQTWNVASGGNYIYALNNGQVTLTNQGTISAGTNSYSVFYGPGYYGHGLTIDNQSQISATGQNSNLTLGEGSYDVVTNEAGATITASGGGQISIGGAFTNNGQVASTGNSSWLQVGSNNGTWTNNGTMTASSGGTLQLEGTYSGSGLGNIVNSGGTVDLSGTLNLGSAALAGPGGGGVYTLYYGTINGGTADASVLSLSSGTLNGVTLTGGYNLTNSTLTLNNTQFANGVTLSGNNQLYLNGNLAIGAGQTWNVASGGNYIYALNNGQVTLTNQGTISAGTNSYSVFYGPGYYGHGLTIDNQNQISAMGQNSNLTLGSSSYDVVINEAGANITASGGGSLNIGGAFTNNGQVTSTGNSSWLQVGSNNGTWTNSGTMTASSGGTLQLEGTYSGSGLGNIVNSGGTVDLSGTLNLGSAALAGPGGGGVYTLYYGTINGGTADASALSLSNGTLNGVTLTGAFNLTNSDLILNNTQFANGVTLSGNNQLNLNGNLTIGAGQTWNLASGGNYIYAYNNGQVTLTNQGTISAGTNSYNYFYGPGYYGYGLTIDNQNQITAMGQNSNLTLGSSSYDVVINEAGANITATGGAAINIGGAFNNQGVVDVRSGSTVQVDGEFGNYSNGTLTGGFYGVAGSNGQVSTLRLNLGANDGGEIVNNAANIYLSGPAADADVLDLNNHNALGNLASNSGELVLDNGYGLTTAGDFNNQGLVEVGVLGDASLEVGAGGANAYFQEGASAATVVNAGSTLMANRVSLTGGTFEADGTVDPVSFSVGSGATLVGVGTIDGDVTNDGAVVLGDEQAEPGTLTVNGDFTQNGDGTLFDAIGPGAGGFLDVSGDVQLAGLIDLDVLNGLTLTNGEEFNLIDAGQINGEFSGIVGANTSDWSLVYGANSVELEYNAPVIVTPPGGGGGSPTQGVPEPGAAADLFFLAVIAVAGPVVRRRMAL